MQRPWLRHYELGVPHTILLPNQPLHRYLERSASRYPQRTALIFYGSKMSYEELERRANRFANALIDLGVRQGDRAMILLPNTPQCVIAYYGALKAGAIVVLSNPLYAEGELERQVRDCGSETLITLSHFYPMARRVRERTGLKRTIVTHIADYMTLHRRLLLTWTRHPKDGQRIDGRGDIGSYHFLDLLKGYPADAPALEIRPEDVAVIQYTGGTTDLPKGIMLTHRNLVANIVQMRHWITDVREGREVFLAVLPFSHVYGMTACMNLAISLGSALILLPTFVTREVLEHIRAYRPTLFPGVPTMYMAINNHPGVRRFGLSSIRACVSGAAPLPIEVQEAFEKLTRGKLVEGYGLTEASPVTHATPLNGLRKTGSIGIPLPSTEAKIVDLESGAELPPGGIGELAVRGPQVMLGYWNRPEETREVLRDGWLYTGDIASLDEDGYFRIIDRKKDMIIAGRYNVYPRDVEEVLYEHPQVFEVAVVGIPPWDENQVVKAYVVLKEGQKASAEEIIAFCRNRLESHAVPQVVEFRRELPKTLVGKVLRRVLISSGSE
ncbi:MAG: long-chain fatty acid--CoA ligase [Chloroflexi bacterium]|nr:long-chain fatty acid--CoA ligase [Chloroflexota bacterium]